MPLKNHAGADLFTVHPLATNIVPIAGLLGEAFEHHDHYVGGEAGAGVGKINGLARNQAQRDSGDFEPYGILDHLEASLRTVNGLHPGGQFVGTVQVGAVKLVIVCAILVIKHHVKGLWKDGGDVRIKPDFESPQVCGVAVDVLLLRCAEGNVGAPAVGAPTVGAGTDAKTRVGEGD